ncbi:hypothetical protein [Streptomyces rishiriensis]|uniref:Lipoprotein n=1 Tax=Streptomyces rishiriensis TaxID=68264 RepID=A0ABU0NJL5_STRRH|nr:hypothetical protein [Streptomyces rishiriensis]MDQ0579271.1 hypothetical protein [Streptomyces rishiriensis]
MRTHGERLRALAGAVLLLGGAVACGGQGGRGASATGTATAPATAEGTTTGRGTGAQASPAAPAPRFDAEIGLPDGRRVGMAYVEGRGLVERHRDADTGVWSAPRLVYATATDRCQSLTLKVFDATVAVIADWGDYCYDGEPPMESLAAVGTADLTRWDTKLTASFDGWSKVAPVGSSGDLLFTRVSTEWLTRLRWSTDGFAEVEEIPR